MVGSLSVLLEMSVLQIVFCVWVKKNGWIAIFGLPEVGIFPY